MTRKAVRYDPANDLYLVLGVRPSASKEEIQRAFRRQAKLVHPDRNLDRLDWANHQFRQINEAHDLLTDDSRRILYDRQRRKHHPEDRYATRGDWWNEPHPFSSPEPDAASERVKTSTSAASRSRASFRPPPNPYLAALRNIILGPYRWILLILLIVFILNVAVFLTAASVQRERAALGLKLTSTASSLDGRRSGSSGTDCAPWIDITEAVTRAVTICGTSTPEAGR